MKKPMLKVPKSIVMHELQVQETGSQQPPFATLWKGYFWYDIPLRWLQVSVCYLVGDIVK